MRNHVVTAFERLMADRDSEASPSANSIRPGLLRAAAIVAAAGGAAALMGLIGEGATIGLSFLGVTGIAVGVGCLSLSRNGHDAGSALVAALGQAVAGGAALALWPVAWFPALVLIALSPVTGLILSGRLARRHFPVARTFASLALGATAMHALVGSGGSVAVPAMASLALFAGAIALLGSRPDSSEAGADSDQHTLIKLMGGISDGLVRLERTGELLTASECTERLFGCQAYELEQQGLVERIHVLDRPAFLKSVCDIVHDGATRRAEVRVRRASPDGRISGTEFFWAEFTMCSDTPVGGDPRVAALVRDISARKEQERMLVAARHEAEAASHSKSRFLATMGHELRTPLNAIVGFAEMMNAEIGGDLAPAHAEYATHISQSGRHLLDVVNMLLDMSKIDAGKFELHLIEFQPNGLIEPSTQMVAGAAAENGIEIEIDVPERLPVLKADERACRQILINLLSNAVKFSCPGGKVRLSMRRQGAKLNLTVADNGIGMSEDELRRVGEPFFQADTGLSRQYEGTGLGLSIVKGLVELHDGTMRAQSSEGRGTTVSVLLPLLGPEVAEVDDTVTSIAPRTTDRGDKGKDIERKQSAAS